ncbi:MAG: enoyl-CoA hydratase [Gammaproteobacteria bacterium]|jgi:acyl dehydratase|nr:enoyl-CoA hydratase [Gammaproteobacteria bacterium]MDG1230940.1 MaoC/PaaZ C-terminal domain-containing protein [Pseudomonadales bacterium]MBT4381035.1 enoyl-CoA hydratase [Gammaproteobacteria bacterium]MBT5153876.1 enoyl-CoA hydratase [Gammaproteobacteria bacterium]MBT5684568.1 enoyl-CoA hydratase [Gammaproteobacteria bacterium]
MPINPEAVGVKGQPSRRNWTSKDALLYAVGIGAGTDELQYTTENTKDTDQKVFPTFAVIVGGGGIPMREVGSFNPALMVHGEQGIELLSEIPAEGEIESVGECTAIYDKGSAAVLEFTSESKNIATGEVLLRTRTSLFCRGEGGWGGDRGPSEKIQFPDRAPDRQVSYTTREDQALTYRLSGDRNPLHSDPSFAAMGGFEKPILHGLCTYGFTGRGLLNALCDGDAGRFKSMNARFSKPVIPGDTLTVSMWVDGSEALFRTTNQDGDVVIDQGVFRFE